MNSNNHVLTGIIVDPIARETYGAELHISGGRISSITRIGEVKGPYIMPGFVDAHVHIESSMLTPVHFARAAAAHGTVAAVADPHEVANVAGVEGLQFMINDAKAACIKLFFGAPSCVPASPFDECAQPFTSQVVDGLMARPDIHFLAEMMNFPGVINGNEEVAKIIASAHSHGKPIDGHAPGLLGDDLRAYAAAGIATDHECYSMTEALQKIALGMHVLIREGSAAKNFEALHALISDHPNRVMLCTDDCHPDELERGHINSLLQRALAHGHSIYDVLCAAAVNPVRHYRLDVGLLQPGDSADFIVVDDLQHLRVLATYVGGVDVLKLPAPPSSRAVQPTYVFPSKPPRLNLEVTATTSRCRAIGVVPDQLITEPFIFNVSAGQPVLPSLEADILKIVVLSRYSDHKFSVGFIHGVGLQRGAIASSIAHDSHHIVALGVDDDSISRAISYIVEHGGGLAFAPSPQQVSGIPLPVFGLMADAPVAAMARAYSQLNDDVLANGCSLKHPFMTMAFMSLTVIPKLKLTPSGLFDGDKFCFTELFV